MADNFQIGASLGLDGEADFKRAVADINKNLAVLGSEMGRVTAQFASNANSMEALTARSDVYNRQAEEQRRKIELIKAALESARREYDENSNQVREWQIRLNNAEAQLARTENSLRQTTDSIENFGDEVDDAEDKTLSFGDILKANLTGTAIVEGVKAIAGSIKELAMESIQLASDLEEVQNVVDTTFGKSADAVREWAEAADTAYGLSLLNAEKFASTLGAMLKSSGIVGEELFEMSTTLAGVAADFASFYNLDVETSFDKIRQAVSGQTEGLKQLGINLSQATLMQTEYAKSLNKTWSEMSAAEQAMTRYYAVLELGSDAIGDFARTSDSYANQTKILELQVENLKTALGERLLPVAQSVVGALNNLLDTGESLESLTASAKSLEVVGKSYEASVSSITAASDVSVKYLDRLEELERQGLNTAESQEEYRRLVEQLNSLIPDLNLTIDEQTGLMQNNADAVRNNIEAWKEAATAQALQERYKDIIAANANALAEQTENEIRLRESQNNTAGTVANLDRIYLQMAEAMGKTGDEARITADALKKMSDLDFSRAADSAKLQGAATAELAKEAVGLREKLMELADEQETYSEAVEISKQKVAEHSEEVEIATKAYEGTLGAAEDATQAITDFTDAVDEHTKATSELSKELSLNNTALKEQAENGSLSLDTILKLIDAGYAAALSVDAETGAVTLNTDAYIALARAKIEEQIVTLEATKTDIITRIKNENSEVAKATGGYISMALAKALANEADRANLQSLEMQTAALNNLKNNLEKAVTSYANVSGGASRSKTAVDKATEAFKNAVKEIDYQLKTGVMSEEEYWEQYAELMKKHLAEGSDAWKDANVKLFERQKKANEKMLKENEETYDELFDGLSDKYDGGLIDYKTFIEETEKARNTYLDQNSDKWGESYDELSDVVKGKMSKALQETKDQYDDAIKDIQDKISDMQKTLSDYGGAFSFTESETGDVTASIGGWEAQAKAITDFGAALDELKDKEIPADLLSEIAAMEPDKGLAAANSLLKLSDADWDKNIKAWQTKQDAAKTVAQTYYQDQLTTLDTEFTKKLTDQLSTLDGETKNIGIDAANGLAQGILSGKSTVANAMAELCAAAISAGQTALDSHSPSRLAEEKLGLVVPAGMAEGITGNMNLVEKAMSSLQNVIPSNFETSVNYAVAPRLSAEPTTTQAIEGAVNGLAAIMGNQQASGGLYNINLYLDGSKVASVVFDPLRNIVKQRGVSLG